jgi:rhodanese-related sulfurtransferase
MGTHGDTQKGPPFRWLMVKQHSPRFLMISQLARDQVSEIDIETFLDMRGDGGSLVVIDVRDEYETAGGYLEGAILMSKGILERDIEKLNIPDDERIVLYCGGGFRSAMAAVSMQTMGWTNVHSLWGGWRAITSAGLPTSVKSQE